MTLAEFKSWFDGFTENMLSTPTELQWKRIKERVGEIDSKPVTERIFIDHYWRPYCGPYVQPYWWGSSCATGGTTSIIGSTCNVQAANVSVIPTSTSTPTSTMEFNSSAALLTLGRADYAQSLLQS